MSHSAFHSTKLSISPQLPQANKRWQRVIVIAFSSLFALLLLFAFLFNTNAVLGSDKTTVTSPSSSCIPPWIATDTASLNDAIACYNAAVGGSHTISVTQSFTLTSATTPIDNSSDATLHLVGNGYAIDGADSYRILTVQAGAVTIADVTLQYGNSVGNWGGGIYNDEGSVTVVNSTLSGNSADGSGGGIYNSGIMSLTNTLLSGNSTGERGGGIRNYGVMTISNSTLSGNSADLQGGGIYNHHGTMAIADSILSGNSADSDVEGDGGGIYNNSGTMTVTDSALSDNSTRGGGGGIYNHGTLTLSNSILSGNSTSLGDGGGIFNTYDTMTVTESTLTNNSSGNRGGGIGIFYGSVTIIDSTLNGNSARYLGGGAFNTYGILTVTSSIVTSNSTNYNGGGIAANYDGTTTVTDSTISDNLATYYGGKQGGGIYSYDSTMTVIDSTLSGNSASGSGGGIYHRYGTVTVTNSTLNGNSAEDGGGVYVYLSDVAELVNTTVSNNEATIAGGNVKVVETTLGMSNSILANAVGGDCDNDDGVITDEGFNLVEDGSCGFAIGGDPLLGLLQDNGGETLTQALLPGSPAIDAGDCDGGSITEDQRGVIRPIGAACDIGAFEAQTMLVSSVSFVSAEYTVSENAETALITVILNALPYVTATVDFATSDGTATAGVDYEPVSSTLTFAPGVTEQTFTVTILHNDTLDGDRTINLALSNPVNATLGTIDTAILTIVDDGDVYTILLPVILKP